MATRSAAATASESWRPRALIMGVTALVGLGLAFGSWSLQHADAWWSNLLANMAVVVLLLIPGELLLTGMRRRFERFERTASRAESVAEQAKQTADTATRSLDDIRQSLLDRQLAELEDDLDVYRNIVNVPTRDSLIGALRQATQDQLITADGVRVPLWDTDIHYRFLIDRPSMRALVVQLEDDDGTVLSSTPWDASTTPEDFYQSLVYAVRHAGHDLGTGLNLPTQSVEELAIMLADVTRLRSQELAGNRPTLRRIIERRNGWYFTERHVIPADNLHYCIDVHRLDDIDWEEHLRDKGWSSAPDAIQFARKLYRIDHPASQGPNSNQRNRPAQEEGESYDHLEP